MTHSETIKKVLREQLVANVLSDQNLLEELLKKGFKGYEKLSLEKLTNTFVDLFGWEKYSEAISTITSTSSVSTIASKNQKYIAYSDSSHTDTNRGFISYVIKTQDNELVFRDALEVEIKDIYTGEALALLTLINKALELGITDIEIYGDNQGLIGNINQRKRLKDDLLTIVDKLGKFKEVSLTWNSRKENKYADLLCRLKRGGVNVTKDNGSFDLNELRKIAMERGVKIS